MSAIAECAGLLRRIRMRVIAVWAAESSLVGVTLGMAFALVVMVLPLLVVLLALPVEAPGTVAVSQAVMRWWAEMPRLTLAAVAAMTGAATGLLWALLRRPGLAEAAQFADTRARLRSILSAAAELVDTTRGAESPGRPHPFSEWVCQSAVRGWQTAWSTRAVRLRQRSVLWERSAAVVGLLLVMMVLLPTGLLGSAEPLRRNWTPAVAELGRELDRQGRELLGSGGVPDSAAIRAAIEQLLHTGRKLSNPELPTSEAELELRRLDAALSEALARLPMESLGDAERARWEALLRRLKDRLPPGETPPLVKSSAEKSRGDSPPDAPQPPSANPDAFGKADPKLTPNGIGTHATASDASVTAPAGGGADRAGNNSERPASSPTLTPDEFRDFWQAAQRASQAGSGRVACDLPAEHRELIRRFRR